MTALLWALGIVGLCVVGVGISDLWEWVEEGSARCDEALAQALNDDSAEPLSHVVRVVSGPRRTTSLAVVTYRESA